MDTVESLGYLKGLIDGLDIDENSKEAKVFKAIVEVLENMNADLDDVYEELEYQTDTIEAIDEDLAELEEDYYDDDDDWYDDDEDEDFEIECPNCGEIIYVDEDTVLEGSIECPNCGETLEFDVEYDDEDEEDE
ncbi:MAG: hypothetical protein IKN26_07110 [Eubacterium sp.]|nr:hypothetical protein [Eubacterium sp.]MBR7060423.1 hypothetical protein [Eubacterium sp.]